MAKQKFQNSSHFYKVLIEALDEMNNRVAIETLITDIAKG